MLAMTASARTKLSLGKSAMQAGGSIQMPITALKGHDAIVGLKFAPELSYFVSRGLALGISPSVSRVSLTKSDIPWEFSLMGTAKYYVDLNGALYPYLGVQAGINWQTMVDGMMFTMGIPVGMLVPLNSQVALNVGAPFEFYFDKNGYLGTHIAIGYLGVVAIF